MNMSKTAIAVVLDKSGSMQAVQADTIGGFNRFLEDQKKEPGEATLTLVTFDTAYDVSYVNAPISEVKALDDKSYRPAGGTALNDAVARAIDELGTQLVAMDEKDRPGRVVVAIITDGGENSSREFPGPDGLAKVRAKVKHQEEKYGWQFTFLGAQLDAVAQAAGFGIPAAASAHYAVQNSAQAFGVMSASTSRGRRGQSVEYTNAEVKSLVDNS